MLGATNSSLILDKLVLTTSFHIVENYENLIQLVMMTNKKEYEKLGFFNAFTKGMSRSRVIDFSRYQMNMKFDRRLRSGTAVSTVQFQSQPATLNCDCAASILDEIWVFSGLFFSERHPR